MEESEKTEIFLIHFKFRPDFLERGRDPLKIFQELEKSGSILVIPHHSKIPLLEEYETKSLYLEWTVRLETKLSETQLERTLLPIESDSENKIKVEKVSLPPPDPITTRTTKKYIEENTLKESEETEETEESEDKPSFFVEEPEKFSSVPKIITHKIPVLFKIIFLRVGLNLFSIDPGDILSSLEFETKELKNEKHQSFLPYEGKFLEVFALHSYLNTSWTPSEKLEGIVVILPDEKKVVLLVDEIITPEENFRYVVDHEWRLLPGIQGASQLGNGEIVFNLELSEILPHLKSFDEFLSSKV